MFLIIRDIQDTLDKKAGNNAKLLELTNKFYTIIPHDFGHKKPPLIDNAQLLQEKLQLLNVIHNQILPL